MKTWGWVLALVCAAGCGGDSGADASIDAGRADLGGADSGGADLAGCPDDDSDGHHAMACGGDDCDDGDPNRYTGNTETCDAAGHDEDCNPATLGPDADGDGYPANGCCNMQPGGANLCGTDCNDGSHDISPMAPESCNGIDDDCDGVIDNDLTLQAYRPDCDGDLYGDGSVAPMMLCGPPATPPACTGGGWVNVGGDCDDGNPNAHPSAVEACNHFDDNCDGTTDEGFPTMPYRPDCDGDGHSAVGATSVADCTMPATAPPGCSAGGWTAGPADDCCDTDGAAYPGVTDFFPLPTACGGFDYDCDGNESKRYPHGAYCGVGAGPFSCDADPVLPAGGGFDIDVACGTMGSTHWVIGCHATSIMTCARDYGPAPTQDCH